MEVVADTAAVNRMLAPEFDYHRTAVVSEALPGGVALQGDVHGNVQWLQRAMDEYTLKVRSDKAALLVVLDNYYKAWRAQVDGKDVPIVRANHAFRGVAVPAGEHEVTFRYDTGYLRGPAIASALILLALMLIAFGSPLLDRMRHRSTAA